MDLCIAACALAHGLAVVTGNGRHFSRVDELSVWLVMPEGVNETSDAYTTQNVESRRRGNKPEPKLRRQRAGRGRD